MLTRHGAKPPFWIYANEVLQNILIHSFRLRTFSYIFDMLFRGIILVGWRRETFCCNLFLVQPQNDQTISFAQQKIQCKHSKKGVISYFA